MYMNFEIDFEAAIAEGHKNRMVFLEDRRRSCLSRWYPLVKDIVPTPRTEIIKTEVDLGQLWDGMEPGGYQDFVSQLKDVCKRMGLPVFLRTGCGSNKHDWTESCFIDDLSTPHLGRHIYNLVEFCGMADLPTETWVIREMLPVHRIFTAFRGNMPITCERRYFVKDGKVICHHPYWPQEAIEGHTADTGWKELLEQSNRELRPEVIQLTAYSEKVSEAVAGYWSVDWLRTKNGWYLTDMGVGDQSYHWPDCPSLQTQPQEQTASEPFAYKTKSYDKNSV
jgi:hypothetical protein